MGYIYLPVSTDPTISDNVSISSITSDIYKHTPEEYILDDKEWSASDNDSSNNIKENITIYV